MLNFIRKILYIFSKYFGLIKIETVLCKIALNDLYKNNKFSHPKNLIRFGFKVFSQQDEDGIIEEIFNRIGVSKKKFIELGVETGIECNTTYLLYKGWSGLWIEGNSYLKNSIEDNFADYLHRELIIEFEKVNPNNINKIILKHYKKSEEIDLLSIDIGTHTYHTLKEINCINSRVIVLEYNAKYGPSIEWVSKYNSSSLWDGTDFYGASLKSFDKILRNQYKLVCCNITGANAFFVRNDLLSDKFINDFSPEYHFNEENYWLRLAFKKTYNIRIK
jgi:hypothetical protein